MSDNSDDINHASPPLAQKLGRKALAEVATIASPETILRWYRQLVAKKCDGSERRRGRPAQEARRDR